MTEETMTSSEPKVTVKTLTPMDAKTLLSKSSNVRKLDESRVLSFTEMMRDGRFTLSSTAISVGEDGTLLNGQHRLSAVLASGLEQPFILLENAEEADVLIADDQGKARTLAQLLKHFEYGNEVNLSSAIRSTILFHRAYNPNVETSGVSKTLVTIPEALKFLKANPSIERATTLASTAYTNIRMPVPAFAPIAFTLFHIDDSDAEHFCRQIASASPEIREGDQPIYAVRDAIMRQRASTTSRPNNRWCQAIIIKGWNSWRNGEAIGNLYFRTGGSKPETFPMIEPGFPEGIEVPSHSKQVFSNLVKGVVKEYNSVK